MMLYEDPKFSKHNSKLKKARMIRGYTQEELSTLADVNIKSLASYEQNPSKFANASVKTALKLADAMNCEVNDLINSECLEDEIDEE